MGGDYTRIFIVSEKRNKFYELTELIPEMMESENLTEQQCIDYFMENLEGTRYMKFPDYTPTNVISEWIIQDMNIFKNSCDTN